MSEPRRDLPPSAELFDRIRGDVARTSSRRLSPSAGLLVAGAIFPLVTAVVLASRFAFSGSLLFRADFAALDAEATAPKFLGALALAVAATVVSVRPGRLGLGSRVQVLATIAGLAAPTYALTMVARPLHAGIATDMAAAQLHPWGLPCSVVALLVGSAALALLIFALRGTVPIAARLRGAALGATAGAWAGLVLFLHCPAYDPAHLLVGHAGPIVVFTAIGAIVSSRHLRP